MASKLQFHVLLFLQICGFSSILSLSPPPQDPEWPGWWCGGSYFGEQGVKCAKLLDSSQTATPGEAGPLCASLKRDGDLFTPHLLVINSKEDEDLAISSIMWGAYLWEGGNIGVWVGRSAYRDSKLPPWSPPAAFATHPGAISNTSFPAQNSTTSSGLTTKSGESGFRMNSSWYGSGSATTTTTNTRVRRRSDPIRSSSSPLNTPECGELRIEVASHGSHGQPSGYGFNPSTVSWLPKLCYERTRVVCQTRKLTVTSLMSTLNKQRKELETLSTKYEEARKDLNRLNESHCGVEPKSRVECGWGGIKAWQCLQRGCCFDSSITGVKYCFKKGKEEAVGNLSFPPFLSSRQFQVCLKPVPYPLKLKVLIKETRVNILFIDLMIRSLSRRN